MVKFLLTSEDNIDIINVYKAILSCLQRNKLDALQILINYCKKHRQFEKTRRVISLQQDILYHCLLRNAMRYYRQFLKLHFPIGDEGIKLLTERGEVELLCFFKEAQNQEILSKCIYSNLAKGNTENATLFLQKMETLKLPFKLTERDLRLFFVKLPIPKVAGIIRFLQPYFTNFNELVTFKDFERDEAEAALATYAAIIAGFKGRSMERRKNDIDEGIDDRDNYDDNDEFDHDYFKNKRLFPMTMLTYLALNQAYDAFKFIVNDSKLSSFIKPTHQTIIALFFGYSQMKKSGKYTEDYCKLFHLFMQDNIRPMVLGNDDDWVPKSIFYCIKFGNADMCFRLFSLNGFKTDAIHVNILPVEEYNLYRRYSLLSYACKYQSIEVVENLINQGIPVDGTMIDIRGEPLPVGITAKRKRYRRRKVKKEKDEELINKKKSIKNTGVKKKRDGDKKVSHTSDIDADADTSSDADADIDSDSDNDNDSDSDSDTNNDFITNHGNDNADDSDSDTSPETNPDRFGFYHCRENKKAWFLPYFNPMVTNANQDLNYLSTLFLRRKTMNPTTRFLHTIFLVGGHIHLLNMTPIGVVISERRSHIAKLLLQRGCNPNAETFSGIPPLHSFHLDLFYDYSPTADSDDELPLRLHLKVLKDARYAYNTGEVARIGPSSTRELTLTTDSKEICEKQKRPPLGVDSGENSQDSDDNDGDDDDKNHNHHPKKKKKTKQNDTDETRKIEKIHLPTPKLRENQYQNQNQNQKILNPELDITLQLLEHGADPFYDSTKHPFKVKHPLRKKEKCVFNYQKLIAESRYADEIIKFSQKLQQQEGKKKSKNEDKIKK